MSVNAYFDRFGFCGRQIVEPPPSDLGITVVIPCRSEPDLLGSLESLQACTRPSCAVEVIVVINAAADASSEVHAQNLSTLKEASAWAAEREDSRLKFHFLHFPDLPPKHAGGGLARKIGMDEALRRFADAGRLRDGIIACYDADCRCEPNYLTAIERHFAEHPRSPACSIYFEHPLAGPFRAEVYDAIAAYELHLRYYVQALRYAGFPHAFHTIGSCMAVRAEVYMQQGGMNKRQAGEDFYFLHKIIPLGGFTDLTTTTVYPSPRASLRVPFGTGKAIADCLASEPIRTYPLQAFLDLKRFFESLPALFKWDAASRLDVGITWPESIRSFLAAQNFFGALKEIQANASTEAAFRKRFFRWCNSFRTMKFVHHARDRFYGEAKIEEAPAKLLALVREDDARRRALPVRELLQSYRRLDRAGASAG
ncbi:MAG: glycosyltransferase [Verrucomicrobia bacterium]|nr:glycosyltransferase [Verrucomicrobiota bacterium]